MSTLGTSGLRKTALVALALIALPALSPTSAAAQGFFDFFNFGRPRPAPPPAASPYADPNSGASSGPQYGSQRERVSRDDYGPSVSYCVRLCDGRYFPIQRSGDASPAELCSAFCPAAKTKVFAGSTIDGARARDGARYADMANAFVYRKRLVDGCTCNGKDAFGLVTMQAAEDPTLKPGDVVATDQGFVVDEGGRKRADFTPIDRSRLASDLRRRLEHTGIAPTPQPADQPQAAQPQAPAPSTVGQGDKARSVQRGK
jgi:hypothetical protein